MPRRIDQSYMLVKTHDGYIKIDRDGNKFPVEQKEKEVTKRTYVNFEKGHIETLLRALEELEVFRGFLTERQTFVETLLIEALDRAEKAW